MTVTGHRTQDGRNILCLLYNVFSIYLPPDKNNSHKDDEQNKGDHGAAVGDTVGAAFHPRGDVVVQDALLPPGQRQRRKQLVPWESTFCLQGKYYSLKQKNTRENYLARIDSTFIYEKPFQSYAK